MSNLTLGVQTLKLEYYDTHVCKRNSVLIRAQVFLKVHKQERFVWMVYLHL